MSAQQFHKNSNISNKACQSFHDLFKGRTDCWGKISTPTGECIYETVTLGHYQRHLKGETSLGIYFNLDDSTCHFAAIDLDEHDWNKAKVIRDTLQQSGIFSYIAASKSNRFHIFLFAQDRFIAKDIRRILKRILGDIKGKIEIFPKQDYHQPNDPDGTKHPGSYINLPCCGITRPFLAIDGNGALKEVPLEIALKLIKRTPNEVIAKILKELPEEPQRKERPERERPRKHPPCIDAILEGVTEPGRDEAAFSLARYYLDELKYSPDDVLGLLKLWDERNRPPLGDERLLGIKVRSAEKGYKFGCKSIIDNDMLSEFCVGEEECEWLKELAKRKERNRYLIIERNAKGAPTSIKVDKKALIDDLKEEFTFKSVFGLVRDDILVYEDGVYTHNGENLIRQECEIRVPPPYLTTHIIHEVRDRIAGTTKVENTSFNTSKYIINLKNGLLDVNTRELKSHTPEFLSTIRIPIAYNPLATCPRIDKFLTEVTLKQKETVLEFFGYALIPDYSIPVVLVLVGLTGSNGKSQVYKLLSRFIGEVNCCAISIRNIQDYPFTLENLEGKLLNIQGDLSGGWFQDINTLKQLSGQDRVSAPRKYKDTIYFDNFARLTFATNQPPKIGEDTLAIWRRILQVDFPNIFRPDDKNYIPDIANVISTPDELSGLLNLALDGLQRVLTNHDFTYEGKWEDRARRYTIISNPVKVFVDECCDIGQEFEVAKDEFYQAYTLFCEGNTVTIKGEAQFGKDLRGVPGLSLTNRKHTVGGKELRWWVGIKLNPEMEKAIGVNRLI